MSEINITETILVSEAAAVAAEAAVVTETPIAVENGFATLGLAPELLAAVADLGFTQPTTVQQKCIGLAMQGEGEGAAAYNDLMVSSQTGSGKTAAFLLPVLHTLLAQQAAARQAEEKAFAEATARGESPKRPARKNPLNPRSFSAAVPGALILCPTRELAQQVAHDAIELVKHCRGLRIANVVGGMPYQMQIARLQNADLVVATPGRLLDLQRSSQIKLDKVQFLVVDEADRMLDLGFADDLAEVHQLTANRHQTMMFSATLAPRIQQLATRVMRNPQRIQVDSPQEKHANIKQVLFWADNAHHKRQLLDHWLRDTNIDQAIVFASTQVECDGLAITFAEFRDRRKIGDIEAYSRQRFTAEMIPGLEPKQRPTAPSAPRRDFAGKGRPSGGYRGNGGGDRNGYGKSPGFGAAKPFERREGGGGYSRGARPAR
jgi:superfamily II DNA/RNA helicase